MENPSPRLQQLISSALVGGAEISLNELIEILSLSNQGMILDQLQKVNDFLKSWDFELNPQMTTGDFETVRIVRSFVKQSFTEEAILGEIRNGESSHIEFKSSLLYDHKKAVSAPSIPLKELRSEKVIHSCLKTIAAFLNCGGGILFVGIDDDGIVKGLEHDCGLLKCKQFNADKWELELRNQITGKYKDGASLNDYITVNTIRVSGGYIARLYVQGRKRLAFIKEDKSFKLYRRQGNRTMEVQIDEIEEFIETRKEQGWC